MVYFFTLGLLLFMHLLIMRFSAYWSEGIWLSLGQPNFGAIEIDWDATPVTVKMEVKDVNGIPVLSVNTSLLELQAGSLGGLYSIKPGEYRRHCSLEVTLPWMVRHRLAILFFCALASKLIFSTSFLNSAQSLSVLMQIRQRFCLWWTCYFLYS